MSNNISPEDRLLKLIKGDKNVKDPPSFAGEKSVKPELNSKESFSFLKSYSNYLTCVNFKNIIIAFAGASLAYLVASFMYPGFNLDKLKLAVSQLSKPQILSGEQREEKAIEFYLESIKRPIFVLPKASQADEGAKISAATPVKDLKTISVVGIIAGENPQAAIEDKEAQKTYYVTRGQFVGEYEVKEIEEGKIILELNGKKYELYM